MTTTYRRAPDVLLRNAGPDVVVMRPADDEIHLISGPAAVAWDLLSEGASLGGLVDEIADLYGRPPEEVGPAIAAVMRDLVDRSLVEERRA